MVVNNEAPNVPKLGRLGTSQFGSSSTEPTSLSGIRWKKRYEETSEDVLYSSPVENPYVEDDDGKPAQKLHTESEAIIKPDDAPIKQLMKRLSATKGDTAGRGGPLLLDDDSYVNGPPEEVRLMAVLYETQKFTQDEIRDNLKPADFVAINAILVLANTRENGQQGWSAQGIAGKTIDMIGRSNVDPVSAVQEAIKQHVTQGQGRRPESVDQEDGLTVRGFDACVATALGSGDLMTALKLLEGIGRLFPNDSSACANAISRNLPTLQKAYKMYPLELRHQADAIVSSMMPSEFQSLLGIDAIVQLQQQSVQRLKDSAVLERDHWYSAQRACGKPEELRMRQNGVDANIDEALKKDDQWGWLVGRIDDEASDVVEAQVANVIATELAHRVHPERTIAAHIKTDIVRATANPRDDGPSFDPLHGSENEYVPAYGANPAENKPDYAHDRNVIPLAADQRQAYLTNPNMLDVAAFIHFLKGPNAFIGQNTLNQEVANAMVDRFVPGMQFLFALVYSENSGQRSNQMSKIIERQFGIKVEVSTFDRAHVVLKQVAPTHPLVGRSGGELMLRSTSRTDDMEVARSILSRFPSAKGAEMAIAKEKVRQSISTKIKIVNKSLLVAQAVIDTVTSAPRELQEVQATQKRLADELASVEKAKVGKGVMGIGAGKYKTEAEKTSAVAEIKQKINGAKAKEKSILADLSDIRQKEGDYAESKRRMEIEGLNKRLAKLQALLRHAMDA